jgi:hypothetical protein
MESYLIQLDGNRVKVITADSEQSALRKAKDEYEGALITNIEKIGERNI